jgi:NhaP-type Na+/H+ or K+/H+ antiporter
VDWTAILWYLVAGALLVSTASLDVLFRKLPVSTGMIYLGIGVAVGPVGLGLLRIDPIENARLLEHLAEFAVIVSLFAAGLKMRLPVVDRRWLPPILLASVGMVLTVIAVTAAGFWGLGLSLGGAVLLGAVLSPTDPVLASEVQLNSASDRDRLRQTLTGEAGLNDGTAFPFVLLGVGLYSTELHELGAYWWRWLTVDLLWAILGGLAVGWFGGLGVARLVIYLRKRFHESLTADEMLTIGMIALIYGAALALHTYGFLAVFAAAVAIRWEEYQSAAPGEAPADDEQQGPTKDEADGLEPRDLARAQLQMTESAERLIEVAVVVLVGSFISYRTLAQPALAWFIPLLLLGIRPAVVFLSTWRLRMWPAQRMLAGWFGIRGIGTVYYLAHALDMGVAEHNPAESRLMVDLCIAVITVSVVVHGISATPLMRWYGGGGRKAGSPA